MPTILFLPLDVRVPCEEGETAFSAARRAGVPIPTACVGRANCGLCRVKVLAGEEALSPLNNDEKKHLGNTYFITRLRLSCQARVLGNADVTLQIPDARGRMKEGAMKEGALKAGPAPGRPRSPGPPPSSVPPEGSNVRPNDSDDGPGG